MKKIKWFGGILLSIAGISMLLMRASSGEVLVKRAGTSSEITSVQITQLDSIINNCLSSSIEKYYHVIIERKENVFLLTISGIFNSSREEQETILRNGGIISPKGQIYDTKNCTLSPTDEIVLNSLILPHWPDGINTFLEISFKNKGFYNKHENGVYVDRVYGIENMNIDTAISKIKEGKFIHSVGIIEEESR